MENIDCQTPREAAITFNILNLNGVKPAVQEFAPFSGIRTARFVVDDETFKKFDNLRKDFEKNSKDFEIQIEGDAKNQFHWVGEKHNRKPTPHNSL